MAHNNLGIALKAQGKLDEAIAEFREAIRVQPDHAMAHNNLGVALENQGKFDDAIAEYHQAIRLQPDDAKAHSNLGWLLYAIKHDNDDAIAESRAAIRLKPDFAMAHNNLGIALKAQGKLDEAVMEYRTAIGLKPDDELAWKVNTNLGYVLRVQGKMDEAATAYGEALRLKPDNAAVYYDLGAVLQAQDKLAGASDAYRAAIRLKPDHAEAHCNLGLLLLGKNRADAEALALLRRGHELGSKQANWRYPSAEWVRQAERAAARSAELPAIRPKPNDAVAHEILGNALRAQGKLEEAVAEYKTAIQLKPDYAEAHNNLGLTLKAQGKLDEAIGEFRAAIRLKPDYAQAHNNLGNLLRALGKPNEAIVEYREAIRLKPDSALYYNNLGAALSEQGKLEDGLVAFRRARELGPPGSPLARDLPGRIRLTEQMIAVTGRLPAVLKGEDKPRDAAEVLAFVQLCHDQGRHAASARLLADALAADPKLGDDRQTQHRYNAACYAALAGCGQSMDDPPPDETARAALRQQALDWLKAERAAWAQLLESGSPQSRATISQRLTHWQQDADLAGVREGEALARLPEGEQQAWRDLWSDVATLLQKAQGDRP